VRRRDSYPLLRRKARLGESPQLREARFSSATRRAAWYDKSHPTFSDALALVRQELWREATFCVSYRDTDTVKVSRELMERLTDAVCYAA
jgi:hypothetical protein